ncbi:MAG TPA: endonuclease MutS2, partial [Cyanobacteria bacterium UBA11049]|nr:endonuclease MutS2 [Cyanobacteria bacterium UBA11049]
MIQTETLELLEWPRLCQHLSTFAATKLGAYAASKLVIPAFQAQSQELLLQTVEVYQLENSLATGLSFEGIQDIGESLERAERSGILTGGQLLAIATTLTGTRQLRRVIDRQPNVPVLQEIVSGLRTYPELEQEIQHCIDEQGKVTDRASPSLAGIRNSLRQLRNQITSKLQGILQRQANAVQEQLITQRGDRFVIPVKATHKDAIPGIVHDASSTGATLYVEPNGIVPVGNQLRQQIAREQAEEEAIRRRLSEQVAAVKEDLERVLAIATTLDLACARARYSLWLGANPPRFIERSQGEKITLRQLRHPLLVWQYAHEQGHRVVPVDLVIDPQIKVVTITGPNTGGKTVTLKTLALAALMAKVGLFVPAKEPVELPWFDSVVADIGDEQSLEQSLSTFSGHIRRISRILTEIGNKPVETLQATSVHELEESPPAPPASPAPPAHPHRALVLLDEVGAGTDPAEGSALAIALLQYLADNAELSIATTHFGELKALKYQDERFENASVEFDEESLSPTYRLLWGIPGRSNALTIARRLGLKPEVIEQAKTKLGGATEDINQTIAGLEAQRRRQETKASEAQELLQQAERLYQQVSQKANSLQERERAIRASQEQAVQQAIAKAKGEIAQVIRQLQQGTPTAQAAQQATNALNQIAVRHLPPAPKPQTRFRPHLGDRVRIPRLGQTAEVLSEPDDGGELTVRFGLMKMTVKLEDIESLDGKKAEPLAKKKETGTRGQGDKETRRQ